MLHSRSSTHIHHHPNQAHQQHHYQPIRSPSNKQQLLQHSTLESHQHNQMNTHAHSSSDTDGEDDEVSNHDIHNKLLSSSSPSVSISSNQASSIACISALCNTILGSGMLSIPYAVSKCGWLVGSVLLLLGAMCSGFALHLLSISARTAGITPTSFYALAHVAVPRATFLIDAAVAIKCFGVATSYLIVIGDLLPDALHVIINASSPSSSDDIDNMTGWFYHRQLWIVIFFICIVMPLSCLRSLNSLRFTAVISVVIVWSITIIVMSYAWMPSQLIGDICPSSSVDCHGEVHAVSLSIQTLRVATIFIFGFTCHQNIFSVCNELKRPTQRRVDRVIVTSISIACAVYLCMALSGYFTFGEYTRPNILTNYNSSNAVMGIARILVAINVSFCFPLQLHPCRSSCFELYAQYRKYRERKTAGEEDTHMFPVIGDSADDERNSDNHPKDISSDSEKSERSQLLHSHTNIPNGDMEVRGDKNNAVLSVDVINNDNDNDAVSPSISLLNKRVGSLQSMSPTVLSPKRADSSSGSGRLKSYNPTHPPHHSHSHNALAGMHVSVVDETGNMEMEGDDKLIHPHDHDYHHHGIDKHVNWKPTHYQVSTVTLIITLLSFTISMFVSNLGIVLAVVGATGSTTISYILPGLCYIQLHHENTSKRMAAYALLIAGCVIVPSSLCVIFLINGGATH